MWSVIAISCPGPTAGAATRRRWSARGSRRRPPSARGRVPAAPRDRRPRRGAPAPGARRPAPRRSMPSTARPAWPATRRLREPGQLLVPDHDRVLHGVGHRAQPDPRTTPTRGRARRGIATASSSSASRSNDPGSSSPSVTVSDSAPGRPRYTGVVRPSELGQPLPAASARGADARPARADHGHRGDRRLAGGDQRAERRGLGALPLRVGGVLDVRAGVDRAAGRAHGGADLELRVRRVGVAHRRVGGAQQASAGRPSAGPRSRPDTSASSSIRRAARAAAPPSRARSSRSTRVRQDRLELQERSQPLDLVEVDPDALPQQQLPPLRHHDRSRPARRRAPRPSRSASADRRQHVRALARLGRVGPAVGDQLGPLTVLILGASAARIAPRSMCLAAPARPRPPRPAQAHRAARRVEVSITRFELDVHACHRRASLSADSIAPCHKRLIVVEHPVLADRLIRIA